MPVTAVTTDPEALTMTLIADFDASVERLFEAFTDPAQLEQFWGPPGWPARFPVFALEPGGRVVYYMTSPQGEKSYGSWEVLEVDAPRSFTVLDNFANEDGAPMEGMPSMRVVFTFESTDTGARLINVTHFTSAEALEQVVAFGAIEGSTMAINQLDRVLAGLRAYAQGKGTRSELLDDTHVRITRLIEGPRTLVWRAHHEPDLLRQWMTGPDGWQMVEISQGETYRYIWQAGEDESTRFGFEGEIVLSEPERREVSTERMIGMEGSGTLNDMSLDEEDGVTLLTLLIEYPDKETRDMVLATGMTDGMEASYARLEQTVLAG